jgi:PHD/YefM family antitoxin component YafN of YafNO toxin-antitoxin module
MQYLPSFDSTQPIGAIAALAMREPVKFSAQQGEELVLMSAKEYERVMGNKKEAFLKAMRELGEEAQRNGMTQEILDDILANPE